MSKSIESITSTSTPVLINQVDAIVNNTSYTSSYKIRWLASHGFSRSQISQMLTHRDGRPMRYQMVKNVLDRPLKKI